jgi:hypothetical protein
MPTAAGSMQIHPGTHHYYTSGAAVRCQ